MSTVNEVKIIDDKNKRVSLLDYLTAKERNSRNLAIENLNKENKLKNFELEPLQLKSYLALFTTINRFSAFKNLLPIFANTELIEFKLKPAELKVMLSMFAIADRFNVLKLLKKTFDIRIHLTPLDIGALEACLAKNDEFNKLLPFDKKKIWDRFFVKDEGRPNPQPIPCKIVTINAKIQKNPRCYISLSSRQREKGIWSREVGATREAGNTLHSKFVMKTDKNSLVKFVGDAKHYDNHPIKRTNFLNKRAEIFKPRDSLNSNNSSQKRDIKNISLELLSIKIIRYQLRSRFDFFKNYVKAQKQVIVFENAEEFYQFIKVFPPHDAIKLLDLPYIKDQIKNLGQQKIYLTAEAYDSLLSYLPENFNKRLLNSITPATKLKRLSAEIFKENNNLNPSMPDVIPQLIPQLKI